MLTALKNHYFPLRVKIIALFLFLLLPLIIVGSTIYQYGYHTIRREITDSSSLNWPCMPVSFLMKLPGYSFPVTAWHPIRTSTT